MKFCSLHSHTTFSYGDGYGLPATHVERVAELGGEALAVTEHGNVSSYVQHEKAAIKAGVKPLFGCEIYTAAGRDRRKWHLTVLAENQVGYRNLMRLVSRSYAEGFYFWPTVSGQMLADHSEGLVVLSGCADSMLACDLLGGKGRELHEDRPDMATARRTVERFRDLFGDRYYLEVQAFPELERTRILNQAYAELSDRTGVPLAATCDVHYPLPSDNEMQKILHPALRGGTVEQAEAEWEYGIRLTYPDSDTEVIDRLQSTGLSKRAAAEAVWRTFDVGQRCTVELPKAEPLAYPVEKGTALETIWEWLRDGWAYRYQRNPRLRENEAEYVTRLKYEMSVIVPKDYVNYFLMLSDVVRFAKDSGIPVGPARGSAAASLVCYLLRITEVDPMAFPLMVFERFIDLTREDLPDVDLDFADDRRDEIRQHLIGKYGADHVGNIGSFVRYRGKNSIDDVARVYRIPKHDAETVKGLIVERSGGDSRFDASLADTRDMFPQAAEVFARHPELEAAIKLEGNYRGLGMHAAGLVVTTKPITDITAVYQREVNKRTVDVLAVDKYDAAYLGLLKADFLGLKTMGMISTALGFIGMSLDELYQIPLDDPETLAAFKRSDVVGIFQFEGRATRLVTESVRPDNFAQLADINALARPGPLFSGATSHYTKAKHGQEKVVKLHPIVSRYTKATYGQIIYQEQVLSIIREMGGFPVAKVGDIRRIISQKLGEASFQRMWDEFRDGSKRLHNVDEALALKIWKLMVTSATYSFNIAHCISYSMIGFWCQWLKQHHSAEFYAAHLSKMGSGKDDRPKIARIIRDADRHAVPIKGPSLRHMTETWSVRTMKGGGRIVRAGLIQVPGIGEKMAPKILEGAPYSRWGELIEVPGIGDKKIASIKSFSEAADPFEVLRPRRILDAIRADLYKGNPEGFMVPTHTSDDIDPDADNLRVTWVGFVRAREYKDVIEDQRARTGESKEEIVRSLKRPDRSRFATLHCYDDGEEDVYLRFHRLYAYPKFARVLEELALGDVVIAHGVKRRSFGVAIYVDRMQVLDWRAWETDEGRKAAV